MTQAGCDFDWLFSCQLNGQATLTNTYHERCKSDLLRRNVHKSGFIFAMVSFGDKVLTAGGDKFMLFDPLRSCGPMLECLRIGNPPPGVPPNKQSYEKLHTNYKFPSPSDQN